MILPRRIIKCNELCQHLHDFTGNFFILQCGTQRHVAGLDQRIEALYSRTPIKSCKKCGNKPL